MGNIFDCVNDSEETIIDQNNIIEKEETFESFFDSYCEKNNWDVNNKILRKNFNNYYNSAEKLNNWPRNFQLLNDKDIMHSVSFPSATKTVSCLSAWYKRSATNKEIALHDSSGQAAKQAQNLRERGFVFKTKDGEVKLKDNWVFREKGELSRKIIGFDPSVKNSTPNWNKLNKKEERIIKTEFNKDFLGNSYTTSSGEIDHRIPEKARKKKGINPKNLTRETLIDGSWIKDFQILSQSTNKMKREACEKCLNGEKIPLPKCIETIRYRYRDHFEDSGKCCENCFWCNSLDQKNVMSNNDMNFLQKVKDEEKIKVDKIKEKILNN